MRHVVAIKGVGPLEKIGDNLRFDASRLERFRKIVDAGIGGKVKPGAAGGGGLGFLLLLGEGDRRHRYTGATVEIAEMATSGAKLFIPT